MLRIRPHGDLANRINNEICSLSLRRQKFDEKQSYCRGGVQQSITYFLMKTHPSTIYR